MLWQYCCTILKRRHSKYVISSLERKEANSLANKLSFMEKNNYNELLQQPTATEKLEHVK